MPRIFLPLAEIKPGLLSITGKDARYLTAVLRCRAGDPVTVCDNACRAYPGRIIRPSRQEVMVAITGAGISPDTEPSLQITLLQGLLKGDKMDLVVQKATELGVSEIIPVITGRSQIRETRKLERWRKIAQEASRQSGRVSVPAVRDTVNIEYLLARQPVPERGIIFWEEGGENLSTVMGRFMGRKAIELFTGPEGGFSGEEVSAVRETGFSVATMGRRILRAETAAVVALGIVQYQAGELAR